MKTSIDSSKLPSLLKSYIRAFTSRRKGFKKGDEFPIINIACNGITIDQKRLDNYEKLCGFKHKNSLPLLYPHVICSPVHFRLFSDKKFPFWLMGIIHYGNHINQYEEINRNDELKINCSIGQYRILHRGFEFDLVTKVFSKEKLLWESISTYLKRGNFQQNNKEFTDNKLTQIKNPDSVKSWEIPSNAGKRYAKISGDYNPIHISSLMAKMFGFKRDIAHGMFALAHCLSYNEAGKNVNAKPVRLNVFFKGPVYLHSTVYLKKSPSVKENRYDLYCGNNSRPSICYEL